ncbi:neuroblastoma-amplified sequence-like [Leptopilina heterotoma]|uniref:neuroblastoma-amplified sequence-like n=1 Tax=Leptopilina heterotoma TaxID=63436 RepID=UPI001CA83DE5|nr:neuroblastoma-amplified sequence-like [Leptopilina heterotoma]
MGPNPEEQMMEESILYELLEYFVKKQEPEVIKCKNDGVILPTGTIKNALRYLNNRYSLPESISQQVSFTLSWKFAIGDNGRILAILQENIIEIRKLKDEYLSVTGKISVPKDAFPQWRKITWSPDGQILVLASSNGHLSFYNSLGNNIFNINPKTDSPNPHILEAGDSIASTIFKKPRIQSDIWEYEFISISYSGLLKSYYISSSNNFEANHEFSFGNFYRNGLNAVVYSEKYDLLFVAGNTINRNLTCTALEVGLSSWRFLNDHPYYKLSFSFEEQTLIKPVFSIWNYMPSIRNQAQSIIFKLSISPTSQHLVCLHTDGCISLWNLPTLKLENMWKLNEQPEYNLTNPLETIKFKKFPLGLSEFHPMDLGWWSDQTIIIARYSGSVSVCSIKNLKNLLGTSPEFLYGQPQVSELNAGRGFLCLDCEVFITSTKRSRESSIGGQSDVSSDSEKDDYEAEANTILNYTTRLVQNTLYSMTDIEKFQPKRKKSKIFHRTYRILGIKSTTPEELYSRKIENEDYEEALSLAKTYNLDTDLVYQTQWRKSEFSLNAISDHLAKVSKRSWVLNECKTRVPDNFEAARELLKFGLRGANLETLIAIGNDDDDGRFKSFETNDDNDDDDDDINFDESLTLKQIQRINKYLEQVDFENLSEPQKELIKTRKKLLDLLDKLTTYENILESQTEYDKVFYEEFRQLSPLENAIGFAKECNCKGVEVMFTYYGSKLIPHWLAILSFFPETFSPFSYEDLLPKCDEEGKLFLLFQRKLREIDWVERSEFSHLLKIDNDYETSIIYELCPSLVPYRSTDLSPDLLTKWYKWRACEIERQCGIVDYALGLINIGKDRNIFGLENLLFELETLDDLVYKVRLEFLSLSEVKKLTDLEKVKLLMSKSSESKFVNDLKDKVLPFIKRKEKYLKGQSDSEENLLRKYMIHISKSDLSWPVKFFQYLKTTHDSDILEIINDNVTLAIECIYACTNNDMYEDAKRIHETIAKQESPESVNFELQEELERELICVKILNTYGVSVPFSFINENKENLEAIRSLLIKMSEGLKNRIPPPIEKAWAHLLNDMLEMQGLIFKTLDVEICFEICLSARLRSGAKTTIQSCGTLMEVRKNEQSLLKVSYEKAVELILNASIEYFNSAKSLHDTNMELAKACLHLIADENPRIKEEYNLIDSLKILDEFNTNILPLQVRLTKDKIKLIETCLQSWDTAYKNRQKLLNLGKYLHIHRNNAKLREGRIFQLIAQKALEVNDYSACASSVEKMIEANYEPSWKIARSLGNSENFEDLKFRRRCLTFTLIHGTPDILEDTMKYLNLLEIQILNKSIQDWMPGDNEDLESTTKSDDEFPEPAPIPQVENKEFIPNILGTSTELVISSANLVKNSTFGILRNAGNKDFWKTALSFNLTGGNENIISKDEVEEIVNDNIQSFPCFYQSLHKNSKFSKFDTKYTKYSDDNEFNTRLKLCQTLLRVSLLSETACYGLEVSDVNHLFLESGEKVISEDCLLGLAYLMNLSENSMNEVEEMFDNLPNTDLNDQLALYYFSLQLFKKIHPEDKNIFLYDPLVLINAMSRVEKSENHQEFITILQKRIHKIETKNMKYSPKIEDSISEEQVDFRETNSHSIVKKNNLKELEKTSSSLSDNKTSKESVENILSDNQADIDISTENTKTFSQNLTYNADDDGDGWDEWENDDWGDFPEVKETKDNTMDEIPSLRSDTMTSLCENATTEEERYQIFEKMFNEIENKCQYAELKETLKQWPDFIDIENICAEKHPVLKLLVKVIELIDKNNINCEIFQEIKELLTDQEISKEVLSTFLDREKELLTIEQQIYVKLCSTEQTLHTDAVNFIKEKYKTLKLTTPILEELFFKNLTASFNPSHELYYQILEEVFSNRTISEIENNIKLLIDRLVEQKNIPHAIALLNQLEGIPPSLSTFDTCLHLLTKK